MAPMKRDTRWTKGSMWVSCKEKPRDADLATTVSEFQLRVREENVRSYIHDSIKLSISNQVIQNRIDEGHKGEALDGASKS